MANLLGAADVVSERECLYRDSLFLAYASFASWPFARRKGLTDKLLQMTEDK